MLKNYIKIAFRNIWRQKGYAFINIFGLAGLAVLILALATVSWQTVKTSLINPVKSLRSD